MVLRAYSGIGGPEDTLESLGGGYLDARPLTHPDRPPKLRDTPT